jgi:hypothetical protein
MFMNSRFARTNRGRIKSNITEYLCVNFELGMKGIAPLVTNEQPGIN